MSFRISMMSGSSFHVPACCRSAIDGSLSSRIHFSSRVRENRHPFLNLRAGTRPCSARMTSMGSRMFRNLAAAARSSAPFLVPLPFMMVFYQLWSVHRVSYSLDVVLRRPRVFASLQGTDPQNKVADGFPRRMRIGLLTVKDVPRAFDNLRNDGEEDIIRINPKVVDAVGSANGIAHIEHQRVPCRADDPRIKVLRVPIKEARKRTDVFALALRHQSRYVTSIANVCTNVKWPGEHNQGKATNCSRQRQDQTSFHEYD